MLMMSCCRVLSLRPCPPPPTKRHSLICRSRDAARRGGLNLGLSVLPLCLALLLVREGQAAYYLGKARAEVVPPLAIMDPVLERAKEARKPFISRVEQAILWLQRGKQAQAEGDFGEALLWYTQIIKEDGDLALAEYARVGRAISLYEVGDKEDAFVEMEDASLSLKGYPALYSDKNAPLAAERQFTIATLLDPHYTDLSYVKETKHWPPSLVRSLERFINLQ